MIIFYQLKIILKIQGGNNAGRNIVLFLKKQ